MKFSSCLRRVACLRVRMDQGFCRSEGFGCGSQLAKPNKQNLGMRKGCWYCFGNQSVHVKVSNNRKTCVDPRSVVTSNLSLDSLVSWAHSSGGSRAWNDFCLALA